MLGEAVQELSAFKRASECPHLHRRWLFPTEHAIADSAKIAPKLLREARLVFLAAAKNSGRMARDERTAMVDRSDPETAVDGHTLLFIPEKPLDGARSAQDQWGGDPGQICFEILPTPFFCLFPLGGVEVVVCGTTSAQIGKPNAFQGNAALL